MTADEFAVTIVIPTVEEALADRGDRRRAYLAAIVTFSVVDYLAEATSQPRADICEAVREELPDEYDVVQGVCNGSKHVEATRGHFRFRAGSDIAVPPFSFDTPEAGFGQGRWGSPGLIVRHADRTIFIDNAVQGILTVYASLYSMHLPSLCGYPPVVGYKPDEP